MYGLMMVVMMAMPPGGDRLPPDYVKPKPPLRETISKPLPPAAQPKPAPPKHQSWAKRHPVATGFIAAGLGAIAGTALCHNEIFICEDNDHGGGGSSNPPPPPPPDDCLWGCGR